MKRPRPQPPGGAPQGTVWFGGPISWFSISLIIRADELVPENVTRLLLVEPTRSHVKGQPRSERAGAPVAGFGSWTVSLPPQETDEWDVSEAVRRLISRFRQNSGVWKMLPAGAEVRLSMGPHLEATNQDFSLPSDILQFCADRNIDIDFDVYGRA
jgi:Domain of unknown function (DUF4279)